MDVLKNLGLGIIRTKLNVLFNINKEKAGELLFDIFCKPYYRHITPPPPPFDQAEKCSFQLGKETVRGYHINEKGYQKILLLHGFSSHIHRFEGIAQTLLEADFEIYGFDAPAHGHSEGSRMNALKYRDTIRKIHENYGPFDGYVAHSLGGLAISIALEELPHSAQTKLVLIAPATETPTAIDQAMAMLKIDPQRFKPLLKAHILQFSGHPAEWFSINRAMKNIQADVLWIHDEDDSVTPLSDVKPLMESGQKNVKFFISKGLGHNRIYREPEIWKKIKDFLLS